MSAQNVLVANPLRPGTEGGSIDVEGTTIEPGKVVALSIEPPEIAEWIAAGATVAPASLAGVDAEQAALTDVGSLAEDGGRLIEALARVVLSASTTQSKFGL